MKKLKYITRYSFVLAVFLAFLFIFSRYFYFRWDLTSDQRYSLSETTKKILQKLENPIIIDVLFTQNIPIQYKKLQTEVIQILEEYNSLNPLVTFRLINPLKNKENISEVLNDFLEKGVLPVQVTFSSEGKTLQEYILPWAIVNSGQKNEKVSLFKNHLGATEQELVSNSVQNLEYAFTDAIYKILLQKTKKIAVLKSNGTLPDIHIADFLKLQKNYYQIAPFSLSEKDNNPQQILNQLADFQLLVIVKPTETFSEIQKQIIDQYLLKGGRILWLIDAVSVNMETMYQTGQTMAMPLNLNLGDLFFKYGFRINYDLVNDLYFTQLVIAQGEGNQTNYQPIPWVYYPMIFPEKSHLISNHLGAIRLQFASSIDTLSNGISKSILLSSSGLSLKEGTPKEIHLKNAFELTDKQRVEKNKIPLGVLLEGNFTSAYEHRVKEFNFENEVKKGEFSKMIVISDGDIIKNDISAGNPMELGYDKWTNNFYDNKNFLQNCVNYLLDDVDFLVLRNKKISLPTFDKQKVEQNFQFWKTISLLFPIIFIMLLFGAYHFWSKSRWKK